MNWNFNVIELIYSFSCIIPICLDVSCFSPARCRALPFGVNCLSVFCLFVLGVTIAHNVQALWSCQLILCLSAENLRTVPDWAKRRSGHRAQVNGHEGFTDKNLGNLGEGRSSAPNHNAVVVRSCRAVPFVFDVFAAPTRRWNQGWCKRRSM